MMPLRRRPLWDGILLRLLVLLSAGRSGYQELACISQTEEEHVATTDAYSRMQLAHRTIHAEGATKVKGKTFVGWTCPAMGQLTCASVFSVCCQSEWGRPLCASVPFTVWHTTTFSGS